MNKKSIIKTLIITFFAFFFLISNSFAKTVKFDLSFGTDTTKVWEMLDLTVKAIDKNGNVDKNFTSTVLFIEWENTLQWEVEFPWFADTTYPAYTFKKSDKWIKKFENALRFLKKWNKAIAVSSEEKIEKSEFATWEKMIFVDKKQNKCDYKWVNKCLNLGNIAFITFVEKNVIIWKKTDFIIKIQDKNGNTVKDYTWKIYIKIDEDVNWKINFYGFEDNNKPSYTFTKKDKWKHNFKQSIQFLSLWVKTIWLKAKPGLTSSLWIVTVKDFFLVIDWKNANINDLKLKVIPEKYIPKIIRKLTNVEENWKSLIIQERILELIKRFENNPIKYKKALDILQDIQAIMLYYGFVHLG